MRYLNSVEDELESRDWRQHLDAGHAAYANGRYPAAEVEFVAALKEAERFGDADVRLAKTLNNLAVVYQLQGKYAFACDSYLRSLAVKLRAHGDEHPDVAVEFHNLAVLNSARRRFVDAEDYFKKAMAMREKLLGIGHSDYASTLAEYASLMRRTGRTVDADAMEEHFEAARKRL